MPNTPQASSRTRRRNRAFLHAVTLGQFDQNLDRNIVQRDDLAGRMDYIGINYYFRANVRSDGEHGFADKGLDRVERTVMGWEVYPAGLRDVLIGFAGRYPNLPPVHITENGMSSDDHVIEGRVDDEQRVRYLQRHLDALGQAIRAGVDVRGYFAWSLMDNFEWTEGYAQRFVLVHVDYDTQARVPKDSALALQALLRRRRELSGARTGASRAARAPA